MFFFRLPDQKYQITNDGLIIKNAQPEDEGVYYCKATVTATGEVKRAEIDVQVMSMKYRNFLFYI